MFPDQLLMNNLIVLVFYESTKPLNTLWCRYKRSFRLEKVSLSLISRQDPKKFRGGAAGDHQCM